MYKSRRGFSLVKAHIVDTTSARTVLDEQLCIALYEEFQWFLGNTCGKFVLYCILYALSEFCSKRKWVVDFSLFNYGSLHTCVARAATMHANIYCYCKVPTYK